MSLIKLVSQTSDFWVEGALQSQAAIAALFNSGKGLVVPWAVECWERRLIADSRLPSWVVALVSQASLPTPGRRWVCLNWMYPATIAQQVFLLVTNDPPSVRRGHYKRVDGVSDIISTIDINHNPPLFPFLYCIVSILISSISYAFILRLHFTKTLATANKSHAVLDLNGYI